MCLVVKLYSREVENLTNVTGHKKISFEYYRSQKENLSTGCKKFQWIERVLMDEKYQIDMVHPSLNTQAIS